MATNHGSVEHLAELLTRQPTSAQDAALRVAALRVAQAALRQGSQIGKGDADQEAEQSVVQGQVGIWQREASGGYVRQAERKREFTFWADVERIPPKSRARRIVLIGESVARGYFYDPVTTPAVMLEAMLNEVVLNESVTSKSVPTRSGETIASYEVIDLCRTDLSVGAAQRLIYEVSQLEPDAVVFWVGNNWVQLNAFSPAEVERQIARLETGDAEIGDGEAGYAYARALSLQEVLPRVARRFVATAAVLCQSQGIAGTIIIPEFNLVDWQNAPDVLLPYLPQASHVAWMRLRAQAHAAFQANDPTTALQLAAQMLALDDGLSVETQRLRGRALLQLERRDAAEAAFSAARDAFCGVPLALSPRCPAPVQAVLRESGQHYGLAIVDLPRLFRAELNGALPDHQLFLDYCHLNLRGLRLALAETARCLREQLEGGAGHDSPSNQAPFHADTALNPDANARREPRVTAPLPLTARDEAMAHLMAAIHNAHHGQDLPTLERLCLQAVELDLTVASTIRLLLDMGQRRTPRWLCASFEQLCQHPILARYLHHHKPYRADKFMDDTLAQAFLRALHTAAPDAHLQDVQRLQDLLVAEHAPERGPVSLLDVQYCVRTLGARKGHTLNTAPAFLQATQSVSHFALASEAQRDYHVDLISRLPTGIPAEGERCRVVLNEHHVAELPCAPHWQRTQLTLPAQHLVYGSNRLEIHWPLQTFPWAPYRAELLYCWQTGEAPHVLPVYGEVCQCLVSVKAPDA